jgi:signal transduction histidine kinase
MATRSSRVPYLLAVIWLLFTVSLASWWLSVGLTLTGRREMFLWEGGVFILVLIAGGLAIVLAIRREQRRREAVETFFMSFTHDIKTSLARVQLQAEGLREDFPETEARASVDRLLADTLRLQIQLENCSSWPSPTAGCSRARRRQGGVRAAGADWPDWPCR